jgi:hypothetical protein
VLSEIDEMAKATLGSITLATMHRLIERKQGAGAAAPRDGNRRLASAAGVRATENKVIGDRR